MKTYNEFLTEATMKQIKYDNYEDWLKAVKAIKSDAKVVEVKRQLGADADGVFAYEGPRSSQMVGKWHGLASEKNHGGVVYTKK